MVGTFCTKRKGGKRKGLKGQITQVKEGRVHDICDLLTQVKKGRVQVICKLLTWVNKGRVQVKVVAPGQQGQGIHYSYRNQFSKLEGFNRKIQVLQPRKRTEKPRKSVFPVRLRNKGRDTAKYQVSSKRERPEKPVFQVVRGRQHFNIQRFAYHHDKRTTQEISFSGQIGKESNGKREYRWRAVGIANSSSIRRNIKRCYKVKTTNTSHTGCDYSTREITREKAENIASTWNKSQQGKLDGRVALPAKRQRNCHNRY